MVSPRGGYPHPYLLDRINNIPIIGPRAKRGPKTVYMALGIIDFAGEMVLYAVFIILAAMPTCLTDRQAGRQAAITAQANPMKTKRVLFIS